VLNNRLNAHIPTLAVVLALVVPGTARAEKNEEIITVLESRTDKTSTERAVEALEAMSRDRSAHPLQVGTALLQARFFRAEHFLRGDAQVAANKLNVKDGLERLSKLTGEVYKDFGQLEEHRDSIPRSGAGLLFWTALSYGRTIESLSIFNQPGAAKRFRRVLDQVIALDGELFHGMPHGTLAMFLARVPGFIGGDSQLAVKETKRALELGPTFADNYVNTAEVLKRVGADAKSQIEALQRALNECDDGPRGAMAEQRMAKEHARVLLKEIQK
jgi:hypothetical protein